jgi:hypothetical protein
LSVFRINSKVIINCAVLHAYVCCTVIAIPKELKGTVSLINKMSGKAPTSVIDSIYCIIKAIFAQDIIMLITSVNRFLTVLTDKLKYVF